MTYFLIIIYITVSFSSIHPIHEKIQSSFDSKIDSQYEYAFVNNETKVDSLSIDLKAMLYSAILPGSGEYSMGYTNRAYLFLGIEALVVGTWYIFNQKGLDTQSEYRAYADEHWSLDRWFYDYYKWSDSGNNFHYNFINEDSGHYPEIWEDSHHLTVRVDGNYISTNSDEFRAFYDINQLGDEVMAEIFFEDNVISVKKNHHYYENIGKYDHFYAGWEDNDALYVDPQYDGRGNIAWSPYKKQYRNTWEQSTVFHDVASYALSSILANHFASMMDVLILSRLSNNKITNLSAKTYFSPLNPYGIGGIKLSFNWN